MEVRQWKEDAKIGLLLCNMHLERCLRISPTKNFMSIEQAWSRPCLLITRRNTDRVIEMYYWPRLAYADAVARLKDAHGCAKLRS